MDYNLETSTRISNLYNHFNTNIVHKNPTMLLILFVVIVAYYMIFASLPSSSSVASSAASSASSTFTSSFMSSPVSSVVSSVKPATNGLNVIEIIMWSLFIFLVLVNGLQYFFQIDITTTIRKIFTEEPEIDINIIRGEDIKVDPEPELQKQVFHVPDNKYTYEESRALCKAYGGRLANYDEIEASYKEGGEWCGYGWSEGQMALFPTQKKTYDELQKIEGHNPESQEKNKN